MRANRTMATTSQPIVPKKRCAIYTRKSTDEGLDQEYNSLEAQRDAGLACKTACKTFQISGVISVQKLPPWVV